MPVNPATYPGTEIFVNKLDIRDTTSLSHAEADLTSVRTEEYLENPLDGLFDLRHLQAIHHHLFQDIYDWAGAIRSYDTRKGICEFTAVNQIIPEATKLYQKLSHDHFLRGLPSMDFIIQAARYYDLTNRIHPFPEGNGRTQRLFFEHLAAEAGHELDWSRIHSWQINEVAIQSFKGNFEPTLILFEDILVE